jgi:CheY-like chemotaxis protein
MKQIGRKPRVLLVDDEKSIREVYGYAMRLWGFEVVVAANTQEALQLYGAGKFDLVHTDHLMPGGTGLELARQIRSQNAEQPIMLWTADVRLTQGAATNMEGPPTDHVDLIVSKPPTCSLAEMRAYMEELMNKPRQRRVVSPLVSKR